MHMVVRLRNMLASITAKQKIFAASDIRRANTFPTIQHIANCIAQYFSITTEDLRISTKGKDNFARNTAVFLSRRLGQCNHRHISDYFTNMSAASVSTAIKRFENNHASSSPAISC